MHLIGVVNEESNVGVWAVIGYSLLVIGYSAGYSSICMKHRSKWF